MKRDVVVTGLGAVTPLGTSAEASWAAARAGESGVDSLSRFDPGEAGLRSRVAGEVPVDPADDDRVDARRMGRYAGLAVLAADEAVADAGLDPGSDACQPGRLGVSVASGMGGLPEAEAAAGGRPGARFALTFLPNLAAGHVSRLLDARGPIRAPATACAAGSHAVADAAADIRTGAADAVVAGGAEAALCPLGVGGFDAMRALSTRNDEPAGASRPFDADRDGFVMAEGAGLVVLEARERAASRGATPYAELSGWARAADAHHDTRPPEDARGLKRSLRAALDRAGRPPSAVDHVNAHATGTPRGDAHEATALGLLPAGTPVTALKGAIGHTLGACGGIEAVYAARSVSEGEIPPTINHATPDCDVAVVTEPTARELDVVVSTSAGFGGANGTLVFERP